MLMLILRICITWVDEMIKLDTPPNTYNLSDIF